jgi:hypothetical protein
MNKNNILRLKITLAGSRPSIWRSILIPANISFFDLHIAIQDAFGWLDCHLHQFHTTEPYKRGSMHRNIIGFPMPEMEDVLDERHITLSEWLKVPKSKIWYEYDFGDTWMHEIKVEKIIPPDSKTRYPYLVDGANACPPEDCGGLGGYYHLLEVLRNQKNKKHKDMLEWLDIESAKEFNPEYFNKKDIKFRNPKKILRQYEKHFR